MFFFARCAFCWASWPGNCPGHPRGRCRAARCRRQAPQILGQALGSTCLAHPGRCLAIAKDALSRREFRRQRKVAATKPAPLTFTAVPARAKRRRTRPTASRGPICNRPGSNRAADAFPTLGTGRLRRWRPYWRQPRRRPAGSRLHAHHEIIDNFSFLDDWEDSTGI